MGYKINIGCGTQKIPGYIGLDCNPNVGANITIDLEKKSIPFRDNQVDAFLLDNSLEHFSNPVSIIENIHYCLKPGGYVEFIVPNVQWFPLIVIQLFCDIHKFWNWWMSTPNKKERGIHYSLWTRYTLKLLLEQRGFKVVKERGFYLGKEFYIKAVK